MPIGYFCQRISYAVFAVVSACCVPVSHADVLAHFAFLRNYQLQFLRLLDCPFLFSWREDKHCFYQIPLTAVV